MHRGGGGARSLNIELQAALNPAGDRKVERFGWTFAPSDKVMQIENDYDKEVYNGDIGYIDNVDPDAGEIVASFDGRSVTYGFGELDMLVPAYAATIHKSQGSEYPAVIIQVLTQHYPMLQRNLLYTGVTRGKRLVVLVGQKKAVAIAVRNVSGRRRWSKLGEWFWEIARQQGIHPSLECTSASLIGHSGSSTFRLSTTPVSMSLTGSCFSSESAPRPFHHGIRRRGGTIFWSALPSTNGRSKRTYDLTSSIVPRGTSFHRSMELEFPPIGFDPAGFHAAAVACSRVHRNSVPSTHIRCMITANRRA